MNRNILSGICFVILILSALSFVSANENIGNATLSTDIDQTPVDLENSEQDILKDGEKTFKDLDDVVNNDSVLENEIINLTDDYTFSNSDESEIGTDGITITKNLTIDGKKHTLNASNKSAILKITNNSHATLKNIIFAEGNAVDGGAINVEEGSAIELINCTFINNFASNNGGAIYIASGNLSSIYNVIFNSNTAMNNGGAIYDSLSTLDVTLTDFSYNNASGYGGAMFIDGVVHIIQTTFDHNSANGGGAIELMGDGENYSTIENSTFKNCSATGDGGAGYLRTDNVIIRNVEFIDNIAGDDGGALYWEGSDAIIYNITCINNMGYSRDKDENDTSSTRGGAICLTGSNVTIIGSIFDSCSAYMDDGKDSSKVDGGALFVTGNDVVMDGITFNDCIATNNGGALYVVGNNTRIFNCEFTNSSAKDGGALYVEGDGCLLYNSTFSQNIADDDGGAIYWTGSDGFIYNITCTNNRGISKDKNITDTSSTRGGTISLIGDNITISKSSFTSSSAYMDAGKDSSKVDGGAVFITGNDIKIIKTEFDDCNAIYGGGAVYIIGNNTQIKDCNFTNTQALVGGAIYVAGDDAVVDGSLFRYNEAKGATQADGGTGGAIYVEGKRAIILNSEFAFDTAVRYGGAISVWGSDSVITNSTFDNSSTVEFYGGSIFVNGFNATISYSNFTRSIAQNDFARGGAIDIAGGNAKVVCCNFDDCYAYFGGDIYVNGANAIIKGSNFENYGTYNKKTPYEGASIYVNGTNTTILKSNFTNFTSAEYGGAIYVAGTNTNISESRFQECIANGISNANSGWGGAIYVAGEYTNIEKSNFTLCKALKTNSQGGAICIQGANTVIKESDFDNCDANKGGDIYVFGNFAKIEDSTFNGSAANNGGAIYLEAWGAIIKGSNVTGCEANYDGGAIYVAGGGTNIIGSTFEHCVGKTANSNYGGGAIYISGPDTHISGSNFNDNNVPGAARGGTINIVGDRTIIDGSYFNSSSANEGGIIYISGEEAVIDSSIFVNSSSRSYGGAISVHGHNTTIRGSNFKNITCTQPSGDSNGGAIYIDGSNTNILNSLFYKCTAKTKGGAIYINNVGTTIVYSNFTLSKSAEGGAILISGENTTISYSNLNNNTADLAGAIKVTGDNTIISNCNLTYNTATKTSGGAMDLSGRNASVLYSWFDRNDAKEYGGAINWYGGHGQDSIIGTTFTNNNCNGTGLGGGAVYWTAGNNEIGSGGLIKDSFFINNTASGHHGGAIDWFHARDSVIDNCLFVNNYAKADGGALYTGDRGGNSFNFTISNSQFYNNAAGLHGGAITNQMANSLIYNNVFDGNSANSIGGTILMKEDGADNTVVDHCYIYNSYCGKDDKWGAGGGAISIGPGDTNITISNCAIINSTANQTYGGAISIRSVDCSLINVSIQNVGAYDAEGGAIFWSGANGYFNNVTIFNSSTNIIGNYRDIGGGAIHLTAQNCNLNDIHIFDSSTNNNNSTILKNGYGGAIYIDGANNVLTNVEIDDSKALTARMNGMGGAIYWVGNSGTLINATISNTLVNGRGGAIYWSGSSPTVENISIAYSQTKVINSTNSADGGSIYTTTINNLKNVYITDSIAYSDSANVYGGAIYYTGNNMYNVNVSDSRATSDGGGSYGGAVYWKKGTSNAYLYNSSFEINNADYGGAVYFEQTAHILNTSFVENVANKDGGAIYIKGGDAIVNNGSFEHNGAKNGGAIFAYSVQVKIYDSYLQANTAEEKGGAIYRSASTGTSEIQRTNLTDNRAFQGSAIYTGSFFALADTILLDNQANSNKFIEKTVGVDENGKNYTSAKFVGFDNVLNAIWCEKDSIDSICTNVTYWGINGVTVINTRPNRSDNEVKINVTVEMYNHDGVLLDSEDLVTDGSGKFKYIFDAVDGETYYFAYIHEADSYYTYLRDTLSNSSLVKIFIDDFYYGGNTTVSISLTDGAWGSLSGNVTVTFNDTGHTNFTVEVINGTYNGVHTFDLPIGRYNATATFEGNLTRLGDTDWNLFRVVPTIDLNITKDVNITANLINVSDVIKYTVNLTNHGPDKAVDINVTEILSPYLKLNSNVTTVGKYNGTVWHIDELGVGETATLTIIAQVIHMGPVTNTVWVISDGYDTNMSNNIASAHNFTALPIVDLRIVKEINATTDTINVTDIIKYTITVFNDGPSNATGVVVGEVLNYRLRLISTNVSVGTYEDGTWNIGQMANGTNATLTIVAEVIYSGNITNEVNVVCYENDTNMSNNYYNITNLAKAFVDLQINKTVNVTGFVNVTDKIKFVVSVYNAGPANVTGVYVSEILSPHLKMISSNVTIGEYDGVTWVIGNFNKGDVHNLTIIAEVISAGIISNAVSITGVDNDSNISNNNDTIKNITALPIVDLEIIKEVTLGGSTVNVSDNIEFTITVINHGPCTATDINVTEILSPLLKLIGNHSWSGYYDVTGGIWYVGNLTNGSRSVLTLLCEVISNGTISNFVFVSSNENDTNISNNNDTIDNITALPVVDVSITKTVNVTVRTNVSDIIEYTITVHNAGPSNSTGVNVTEVLSPYLRLISNETIYGYYNVTEGIWYIGNINNGSSVNLTLTCEIIGNGTVANDVFVVSNENDTNIYNNEYHVNFIADPIVDVNIVKNVNITSNIVNFADKIKFTITVHNSGPSNATGVWVSEILDSHLKLISYNLTKGDYDNFTWNIYELNRNETVNLTIIAQVISIGNISNAVEVHSVEKDTNISNNNDSIDNITALPIVDLSITKVVNFGNGTVKVGDLVQFTIDVVNNGPCAATNVTVVEKLSPHLKLTQKFVYGGDYNVTTGIWYIGDLDVGGTAQLIIQAKVISNGTIANVVVVNSTENDTNKSNNNDTIDNITALPAVDLNVTKSVNASVVNVTDTVKFTISVTNNGPSNATGVNVNEVLSPNLKLISNVTDVGYYNKTTGIWYIGDLANNATVNLTIVCKIISDGLIDNYVEVTSHENDTNPYNNWDEIAFTALPIVDIEIRKEVNVTTGFVNVTDLIEFAITVHNNGPSNATSVLVGEIIDTRYLRIVSNKTSVGGYDGFSWNVGNLANGASENLTIICEVIAAGSISNSVNVTSYQNDTNKSNNNDSIDNITALPIVDLSIIKKVTLGSGVVNVGDFVQFEITVHNKGPCDATNVTVVEKLSPLLEMTANITWVNYYNITTGIWYIGDLAKNTNVSLIIQARVISNGTISNFVVVSSTENDTNLFNNNDTIDNITALPVVDLFISKSAFTSSGTNIVKVGDEILYMIYVQNNGPSNATDVVVNETLSKLVELTGKRYEATPGTDYNPQTGLWTVGNLTNGGNASLSIWVKVISNGTIENVVVVNSTENDTNPDNNNASSENITALPVVDLIISKEVNVTTGVVNVSDVIKFTITVTNNGPSNATGVNVSEVLSPHLKLLTNVTRFGYYDVSEGVWYVGLLTNGSTAVLTLETQVISNGTISNIVIVTSHENDTNTSNNKNNITNITALPIVDLSINKTTNLTTNVVKIGDYIKFTIFVQNNGPSNAINIHVSEILSPLLKLIANHTTKGEYKNSIWTIPYLANSTNATLTLITQVIGNGTIKNAVNVTSDENDTNKSNNNDTIPEIESLPVVNLTITKTTTSTVVNVTDDIVYVITVHNWGPSNATNVIVRDILSKNVALVSNVTSTGWYDVSTGIWTIGKLNNGSEVFLALTVKAIVNGTVENTANVTCSENSTDNSTANNVTVLPIVDVGINKTVDKTTVKIGETITYTIFVYNNGPSNATDVRVAEILSPFVQLMDNVTDAGYYDKVDGIWHVGNLTSKTNATLTLTVEVISKGIIENVVFVKSNENDTNLTNNNYTCENVTVDMLYTPIDLYAYDIYYGDEETLTVALPENASGTVNITVNGKTYPDLPITNGIVKLPLIDLAGGNYTVDVSYGGDGTYLPNSTAGKFRVLPLTPIITIEVADIWVGEIEVVNVTVNAPGMVFVTVYGKTVEIPLENGVVSSNILKASFKPNYHGNATWKIGKLPVGTYPAFALYPGNENYTSVNITDVFHVRDKPSTVVVTAKDIYVGEEAVINIVVGPKNATGSVVVNVEGKNYTLPLDDNNKATLKISKLKAGLKHVTVWYNGTLLYRSSKNTTTFNVLKLKPPVDVIAPDITVGDDGKITVNVPKDANGKITIEIVGKKYTKTIKNGKVVFNVPGLKVGVHNIRVFYSGDDKYLPANTTGAIKVKPVRGSDDKNDSGHIKRKHGVAIENQTSYDEGNSGHVSSNLEDHKTANPILLLLIMISLGLIPFRKFKR